MYSSLAIYKLKNGLKKDLVTRPQRGSNRSQGLLPLALLKRLTSLGKKTEKRRR